jgi:hypothetical protein
MLMLMLKLMLRSIGADRRVLLVQKLALRCAAARSWITASSGNPDTVMMEGSAIRPRYILAGGAPVPEVASLRRARSSLGGSRCDDRGARRARSAPGAD